MNIYCECDDVTAAAWSVKVTDNSAYLAHTNCK